MSFIFWSVGIFLVGYFVGAHRWQKVVFGQLHNMRILLAQTDRLVDDMKNSAESMRQASPRAPVHAARLQCDEKRPGLARTPLRRATASAAASL